VIALRLRARWIDSHPSPTPISTPTPAPPFEKPVVVVLSTLPSHPSHNQPPPDHPTPLPLPNPTPLPLPGSCTAPATPSAPPAATTGHADRTF
jgi:hypothetical protein